MIVAPSWSSASELPARPRDPRSNTLLSLTYQIEQIELRRLQEKELDGIPYTALWNTIGLRRTGRNLQSKLDLLASS